MKTNAELSKLVTQAVDVLERHAPSDGINDKEAIKRMGIIFHGPACRKASANASPDELSKLVRSAINVLQKHESPEIFCDHEAMSVLHSLFDGPRCRKALRNEPHKRSELFTAMRDCGYSTQKIEYLPANFSGVRFQSEVARIVEHFFGLGITPQAKPGVVFTLTRHLKVVFAFGSQSTLNKSVICLASSVQNEVELLKEELALAKAENDRLRLQLHNVMVLLKLEMTASGTLPKVDVSNTSSAADRFALLNQDTKALVETFPQTTLYA